MLFSNVLCFVYVLGNFNIGIGLDLPELCRRPHSHPNTKEPDIVSQGSDNIETLPPKTVDKKISRLNKKS